MSYSVGSIKKVIGKDGKEFFSGDIVIPVIGFRGAKSDNQDLIYFFLDLKKANFLASKQKNKGDSQPQEEVPQQ